MTSVHKTISLLLILPVLLSACATPAARPAEPPPSADRRVPQNPGKELGRQFIIEARTQFRFVKDQEVVDTVNRVGRRLVRAAGGDPDEYHFFVVRDVQPNAFAIPGGYIFVFDGLLSKLEGEAELAGVLAHEIGHVTHNHFFKDEGKVNALTLATIAAILLSKGSGAAANIALAANISAQLQFSRENEEEADRSAVQYLRQAGYDPRGLLVFFQRLAEHEKINSTEIPAYLLTHPALNDRLHMVELRLGRPAARIPAEPPPLTDWGRMEAVIRAKSQTWKDPAQIFPRRPADVRSEEREHYLAGLAYLTADRTAEAIAEYRAAAALAPANPVYRADLAQAYLKGQDTERARGEALESLKRSGPGAEPETAHLVLGMLEEHAGRPEEALRHYKKVIESNPDHAFAHYHAGQAYFQTGKTLEGAYHTGRYLRLNLEPEAAFQEFNRAKELASGDSELARKIREEIDQINRDGI